MKEAGLLIIVGLIFYACQPKLEDREDYKKGYEAGHSNGVQDGEDNICGQVEGLKDSIYNFLQNAGICP